MHRYLRRSAGLLNGRSVSRLGSVSALCVLPSAARRRRSDGGAGRVRASAVGAFRVRVSAIERFWVRIPVIRGRKTAPDGAGANPRFADGRNSHPRFIDGRGPRLSRVDGRNLHPSCADGRNPNPPMGAEPLQSRFHLRCPSQRGPGCAYGWYRFRFCRSTAARGKYNDAGNDS